MPTQNKQWQWGSQEKERISFRYAVDQKAYSEPDGAFSQVTVAQLSDVNGIWYIHVQAKDRAGNVSEIEHASAILDNQKPEIKGLANVDIPQKKISWSWFAEDADPHISFRWGIDQKSNSQLTGSYTTKYKTSISEGDGIRYLYVQAIDRAGNASDIKTVSGILDNTAPDIQIMDNDPLTVQRKKWQWKGIDADSHIVYRYILTKKMDPKRFGSFTSKTSVIVFDENNELYIHVQAKDRAGNLSKIVSASKILDNTPPVIKGLENDVIPKTKKNWSWYPDPLDDKVLYQYSINQQENANPTGPFRSEPEASISSVDGKWYLHVVAKDMAGNLSKKVTVSAILDNTPPEITGLLDDIYPVQSKSLTWTTQDSDPHVLYRYQIDQHADSSPTTAFTHVNSVNIADLSGNYYFHIQAKDRAGNISNTVTVSIVLDNLAPVLTGLSNIENPVQSIDWRWKAKDADKSLTYRYLVYQRPVTELYTDFSKTSHAMLSELNGRWFLNVQAKDRAGNLSEITSVWATFDNICPVIGGLSNDPNPRKSKKWQWHATDADPRISYRFLIDQNANSQPAGTFENITQASLMNCDGKWYLHVQAKDSAGNISSVTTVHSFMDNTPPEISGISSDSTPVKQIQWHWSSQDADTFVQYRYIIDQSKQTKISGKFSNVNQAQITSGNGIYYLHVQAQDRAMNISETVTVSTIIDNHPPAVINLSNDDVPKQLKKWQWQANDDDNYIVYRWLVDQQADSEPAGSYTYSSETTLTNETGRWYIHVQAKDRAGNVSQVETVSAILDNQPPKVIGLMDDSIPKQSVKFNWQGQDNQDSNLTYRSRFDRVANRGPKTPFQSRTYYSCSGINGQWYLHVQAKDSAGNISPVSSAYVVLDNIAPVITGLSSDHRPVKSKNWTWQAEDADSDIVYRYAINQQPLKSLHGSFDKHTNARIKEVNGLWFLHVQAKDRAGNLSDIYSVTALLDNTPPVFEEMIDDIIPRNTKKWEWCARDEDSQIRYRFVMDQKPFSIPTGPFTNVKQTILTEKNGKWYVHIQAKDRAGNISPVKTVFAQMTTQKEGLNYNINVNFFSSAIKPIHNKGILSLGKILQTYPNTVAIIEAHTDNIGEQNKNLRLSQKRADYVRKILIERSHISPDRIKSFGYGSTRPIADNNTPEGQLKNRRAEALIFYTKMNE